MSTPRWRTWTPEAPINRKSPDTPLTELTKPTFVSSVSAPSGLFQNFEASSQAGRPVQPKGSMTGKSPNPEPAKPRFAGFARETLTKLSQTLLENSGQREMGKVNRNPYATQKERWERQQAELYGCAYVGGRCTVHGTTNGCA